MQLTLLPILALAASTLATEITRCGAPTPPARLVQEAARQAADEDAGRDTGLFKPINVTTYVHVVTTPSSANNFTTKMITDQITYMNDAYNPWNISFYLAGLDYTVNTNWATAAPDTKQEKNMKAKLRQGGYRDLNLYFLSDLGDGLLGFCYFPVDNPTAAEVSIDGCINLAGSLPGGNVPRYNLGGTAAHEVGHWFGLFHVFQGRSCTGKGDYVGDTAIQRNATSGCPKSADSCPGKPGLDNIHNYMDYSTDICYEEFTYGQSRRMHKMYNLYRA